MCSHRRNKRDSFADSARAYAKARQLTESDCNFQHTDATRYVRPRRRKQPEEGDDSKKRGAPCVNLTVDASEESLNAKKAKAAKRLNALGKADVQQRLSVEAAAVISKLFSTGAYSRTEREALLSEKLDPRLENFNFVFKVGLNRYAKRCRENSEGMCVSKVHDVAVASAKFVKQQRKKAAIRVDLERGRLLTTNNRLVELLSRLSVAVWNSVSLTDFFRQSHGSDSFRPFVSGIMYGMKRGLTTRGGITVLPSIPVLSTQLPTLRSSAQDPVSRQLQASSHRGLCSLMRAISSYEVMSAEEAAEITEKLRIVTVLCRNVVEFCA